MQKRYIKLESEDLVKIEELKKTGFSRRDRERSHALLLSNKGYDVKTLAEIFGVRQATILDWFNRWESEGLAGLSDRPKSGRPKVFKPSVEKKF